MKSLIKVSGIYIEDLFNWFYNHVISSGGDGCGYIICENYKEAADYFIEWWKSDEFNKKDDFLHPRNEYDNVVNFNDSNKNFIFSNKESATYFGDYMFIVCGECQSYKDLNRKLLPISIADGL